jgi:hypothetical protein
VTLAALTLSAILAFPSAAASDHAERPRLEALANDIAHVVVERDEVANWLPGSALPLPVDGKDARRRTALALVAIAYHESGFDARVSDCRRVGSDFPSISAFQLLGRFARGPYTRAELCASPRLAAKRALFVLAHHAKRCGSMVKALRGYASGDGGKPTKAGRELHDLWQVALWRARL